MDKIINDVIKPAFALLPDRMASNDALVLMLTFGLQESRFEHRDQLEKGGKNTVLGPALSFWQFERLGGVKGVLEHPQSRKYAQQVCDARGVKADPRSVWERMATDDILGAVFARLLIWTDPMQLPTANESERAWRLYLRTWRPGAYDRGDDAAKAKLKAKFLANHAKARGAVK